MEFIQAIIKGAKAALLDHGSMVPSLFIQGKDSSGKEYKEMILMATFPGGDFTPTVKKGRYLFEAGKDFRQRCPLVRIQHLALVAEAWTATVSKEALHLRDWKFVSQAPNRQEHLIIVEAVLSVDPTVFVTSNPKKRYRREQRSMPAFPPQRLYACEMIRSGGTLDLLPDKEPLPVESDLLPFFLSGCAWVTLSPK